MEAIAAIAVFILGFAVVFSLLLWVVWLKYRMITLVIPCAGDTQAFNFKLTESIRSLGFREAELPGPGRLFRAPAWMKWAAGLQDITVEPAAGNAVRVSGPGFYTSWVGRGFAGISRQPYPGRQPAMPLFKAILRLMGSGVAVMVSIGLGFYLFAGR